MRRTLAVLASWIVILALVSGCPKHPTLPPISEEKNYGAPLPPGLKALVKIDPSMYPDFSQGFEHRANLREAALYSKQYLMKKSSQSFFPYLDIDHQRALTSIDAFVEVLDTARSGQEMDQMIRQRFDVYQSRGYQDPNRHNPPWTPPDTGVVLFTGYYRPIFDARLQPEGEFKWPLYRKPEELVLDPATLHYHRKDGQPFLTRDQIEHGALAGRRLELCYLKDRFEAYIVTVQGSGKLRMADGNFLEIGYAGDNGYEYVSIAQELVKQRYVKAD